VRWLVGVRWLPRGAVAGFLMVLLALLPAAAARAASAPPKVGEKAPHFEIQGFKSQALEGEKHLLLVFYRGHF